jgi:hypothetical protein
MDSGTPSRFIARCGGIRTGGHRKLGKRLKATISRYSEIRLTVIDKDLANMLFTIVRVHGSLGRMTTT